MTDLFLDTKKEIERLGFNIIGHDFNRPWGGFLLIDESQSKEFISKFISCLLYTSPSPRDGRISRMPSSA